MIFISAGHHAAAKGAAFGDFVEYDEALIWQSLIIHHIANAPCAPHVMPVPSGVLREKTRFINSWSQLQNDVAVEIHFNSAVNADGEHVGRGSETLYYPESERGKRLALDVQAALSPIFQPDRGAKAGYYRMDSTRGVDWFLEKTKCTAIIIEPDFVQRAEFIRANREAGCVAIAETLLKFTRG